MPQFAPFDYGNVLTKAEGIRGARTQNALAQQQLDPNSPRNQLVQEQLQGARQGNVMAKTQFDQQQQLANTQELHQALTEIANNPAAADFHVPRLKEKGILRADFDYRSMSPQEIQTKAAEGAQALGKSLGMTEKNEGYTLSPGQKRFDASGKEVSSVPPSPSTSDGTAMERARTIYGTLTMKLKNNPGYELSEQEQIAYGNAVNALQQERLRLDPQGNLTSFRPDLPSYGRDAQKGGQKIVAEGRKTKADKNKINRVRKLAQEVRGMVEQGRDEPFYKRPTGPAGYITSKTQGLRDLGVPVPRAGFETSKRIEEINFLLAPYISGEKGRGISNYDRQRIEKLLGSIDSPMKFDADAVLSAMDIVESYGDRLEDETGKGGDKKAGPESLGEGEEGEFDGKRYRRINGKLQMWED